MPCLHPKYFCRVVFIGSGVIEPTKDQLAKKAWYIVIQHGGEEYYVKKIPKPAVVIWTRYRSQALVFMTESGAKHFVNTNFLSRPEVSAGNRVAITA